MTEGPSELARGLRRCENCGAPHNIGCKAVAIPAETLDQAIEAMVFLMGGPGWEARYECGDGVPIGKLCSKKCRANEEAK